MSVDDKIIIDGFVKSIKEGNLTIEQVPDKYKEQVQELLEVSL